MVSHKIFKRVLKEYFRYILMIEKECGNECCVDIPFDSIWFNLEYLHDYFDESEISEICYKYFRKIDPVIQKEILQNFPNLEPYFNENLWFQKNEPTTPISISHFPKWTSKSSKLSVSNYNYFEPSASGYSSPESNSSQNSPVGSRESSPVPTNRQEKNSTRKIKRVLVQQNHSVNSTDSEEEHVIKKPRRYNFRQKPRKRNFNFQKRTLPKRKYNKRLKLHAYLNELPNNFTPLQPHESNLILKSDDGRQITDLNLPLPICKNIQKQCRKKNPITKRFSALEDDGSENVPLNMYLIF